MRSRLRCKMLMNDLIPGRNGRLMDQADEEGEALGRREIPEVGGVQRAGFCGLVSDLGIGDAFQDTLHIAEGGQPGQFVEPLIQMRQAGTLRCFLDPVKVREVTWHIPVNELFKESLFCAVESVEDGLKDPLLSASR